MKRFYLSSLTAVLTFLLGVAITFSIILLTPLPNTDSPKIEKLEYSHSEIDEPFCELEQDGIEIQYFWSLMGKDSLTGFFGVTNNSTETIYFPGYEKNSHVRVWIKQNKKLEPAIKLSCGNGLKRQELRPGEFATFTIPVPDNNKPFEVGFDFLIGEHPEWSKDGRELKTIWVKVNRQWKSFTGYEFENE